MLRRSAAAAARCTSAACPPLSALQGSSDASGRQAWAAALLAAAPAWRPSSDAKPSRDAWRALHSCTWTPPSLPGCCVPVPASSCVARRSFAGRPWTRRDFKPPQQNTGPRRNEQIQASEVRLVHADGRHEVMPTAAALQLAEKEGLDLVEVTAGAKPPVCRLINYDSLMFQTRRREKEARKKDLERKRHDEAKEIRFKPFIAQHDIDVKLGHAEKFLQKGHKVKLLVRAGGQKERLAAQETLAYLRAAMADKAKVSDGVLGKQQRNAFVAALEPLQGVGVAAEDDGGKATDTQA